MTQRAKTTYTAEDGNFYHFYSWLLTPDVTAEAAKEKIAQAPLGQWQEVADEMLEARLKGGEPGLKAYVKPIINIRDEYHRRIIDVLSGYTPPKTEKEEPKERPYQLRTLGYFKNFPKPEWEVENILRARGTSLFIGDGASGKSTFVLDMFLSLAVQRDFIGRKVSNKPHFVVWVAAESVDQIYPRASAWLACQGVSEELLTNMLFLEKRMPLNNIPEVETFIASVRDQLQEIGVTSATHSLSFIFDTYARCTPGADENSTQETKIIADSMLSIADAFTAHVCTIHHMNAQGRIRGNTALRDAVDTVWNVEKTGSRVKLHCDKMRGTLEPEDFSVEIRSIVLDENDPSETAPVIFPTDTPASGPFVPKAHRQMLEVLHAHPLGLGYNEWAKYCEETHKISNTTFYTHLKNLTNKCLVEAQGEKVRGKKVTYVITTKGMDLLGC